MTQPTNTKEKILNAAQQLFAENGFAGTSMGNIAKLAKINHSLIFHHFGNKAQLWVAVKQHITAQANRKSVTLPETDLPFDQFLKELFTRCLKFYKNNPDLVRMMNWQRMEANAEPEIGVTASGDMQKWADTFKHYQNQGEINPSLKPEFIVTMILAIISSAALDPNVFIKKKPYLENYLSFCITCLKKGLQ